jgi:hypothetical protein
MTKAQRSRAIKDGIARKKALENGIGHVPVAASERTLFEFNENFQEYRLGGIKFDIADPENAKEIVRRLNK